MIYPSNQTTPRSGSYLWNWLGSPLKKFAAALAPYMGGGDVGYKKYVALLSQSGTNDPVASILENTLGSDIIWKRSLSAGIYYGENANFVDSSKVWMSFTPNYSNQGFGNIPIIGCEILIDAQSGSNPALWFTTAQFLGAATDNWGSYISVEIRVYP